VSYFNEEPKDLEAWTKSETERLQADAAKEVETVTVESIKTRIATAKAGVETDNKAIDVENKTALDAYNKQWYWPMRNWNAPTPKEHKQFALSADLTTHQLTEDKINADDFKLSEEIVTALTTKAQEDAKAGADLTEVTAPNHIKYTEQVATDNAASWKRAAGVQAIAPVAIAAGASLYGKSLDAAEAQKIADAEAKKIEADKKAKALAAKKAKEGETPAAEQKDPVTGEPIKVDGAKDPETPGTDADADKTDGGLGAWWILIVLAILALVGGAVYFFVFMPKEEDEEFDAEAQVEEEL